MSIFARETLDSIDENHWLVKFRATDRVLLESVIDQCIEYRAHESVVYATVECAVICRLTVPEMMVAWWTGSDVRDIIARLEWVYGAEWSVIHSLAWPKFLASIEGITDPEAYIRARRALRDSRAGRIPRGVRFP